jgi:hypothetical protein
MSTYENAADLEFFNDCLDTLIKVLLALLKSLKIYMFVV